MRCVKYDLGDRTIKFSTDVISLSKKVTYSLSTKNIQEQLLRSSTSIGANYQEANGAISRSDFRSKIAICKKEALETQYWLKLIKQLDSINDSSWENLLRECHELILIFSKIFYSSH